MSIQKGKILLATILASAVATPAMAAAGDTYVRLRGIMVAPNEKSGGILPTLPAETVQVNNAVAGSGGRSPIGDFDTVLWERILRVNLTSPAWLCRAAISHMLAAGHGSIVNVGSSGGTRPMTHMAWLLMEVAGNE